MPPSSRRRNSSARQPALRLALPSSGFGVVDFAFSGIAVFAERDEAVTVGKADPALPGTGACERVEQIEAVPAAQAVPRVLFRKIRTCTRWVMCSLKSVC